MFRLCLENIRNLQLFRTFILKDRFFLLNWSWWFHFFLLLGFNHLRWLLYFLRACNLSISRLLEWAWLWLLDGLLLLNWCWLSGSLRLTPRIRLVCCRRRCHPRLDTTYSTSCYYWGLLLFNRFVLFDPTSIITSCFGRRTNLGRSFCRLLFKSEDTLEIRYRLCLRCLNFLFSYRGRR